MAALPSDCSSYSFFCFELVVFVFCVNLCHHRFYTLNIFSPLSLISSSLSPGLYWACQCLFCRAFQLQTLCLLQIHVCHECKLYLGICHWVLLEFHSTSSKPDSPLASLLFVQLCNVPIWCCLSIKSLSIVQVASPKLYGNSGLFLIRVLILSVICPGWARALLIASSSKVLNCDKISRIRASSCLLKRS